MRLDAAFRLSTYLSLVMASACLGYAEQVFLPRMAVFGAVMGLVLAVAFVLEGRWSLSVGAANALGLAIAAGAGFWIAYHLLQPLGGPRRAVSHPAAMLPYMGPVLMVILAAKLFRPKQVNDFWGLHTLGLLEVVLACVLASQALFGLFLVAYLGCLLWSLMLFSLYRGRVAAGGGAAHRPGWRGTSPGGRWTVAVLILGMVVFLLTPQWGGRRWDPAILTNPEATGMQTGFATDIDLNRTGDLQLNDDVALEVYAEKADFSPKLDLTPQQRWRGATVDHYMGGRWTGRSKPPPEWAGGWRRRVELPADRTVYGHAPLPDLGPRQYFLTVTADPRTVNRLVLAEPVVVERGRDVLPVVFLKGRRAAEGADAPEMVWQDGALWPEPAPELHRYRYRQVTRPLPEPDLGAPVDPEEVDEESLCFQPVPRIRTRTAEILDQLVAQGTLRRRHLRTMSAGAAVADPHGQPAAGQASALLPQNRERVARALSDHLARSGEYVYTLSVRREDPNADPVEDFLCNRKRGHCECFSAALALMLRAQGLPARVVLGFRGAESQGGGHYVVRQSHAHSWVEVLVPRRGNTWHWLALDPTPARESMEDGPATKPLPPSGQLQLGLWWKNYILEYNLGQQTETMSALWGHAAALAPWSDEGRSSTAFWGRLGLWVLAAAGAGLVVRNVHVRRLRPRQVASAGPAPAGFYGRLLRVLARRLRLTPRAAQTPGEFAACAARALEQRSTGSGLAQVPGQVVRLFYRVRYGGQPLTDAERQEVDRRLGEMDAALAERSPG